MIGGICLFGESADIKNDSEDTADNIGETALLEEITPHFFLVKIRTSVIVLKYNPIIL